MLIRSALLIISTLLYQQVLSDPIQHDLENGELSTSISSNGGSPISDDKDESLQFNTVVTSDVLKQMMWKKCSNKGYMTCMKLALVHMVDKLDKTKSNYQIVPGITIIHRSSNITNTEINEETNLNEDKLPINKTNISELLDQYLMNKITNYLENLNLNVKILDDNLINDIKTINNNNVEQEIEGNGDLATGRAKSGGGKKNGYKEHFIMAALASGGTLIALAFKTIALLAGKALITSLISLAIAAISAFKGHHHSEPKSTTYEIVTKPIVTHTDAHHGGGGHGGHGGSHDALEQSYAAYKRSIDVKEQPIDSSNIDKVVYRIHTTTNDKKNPVYIPIETGARKK